MSHFLLKHCAFILNTTIEQDALLTGFCVDSRLLKPGDLFFALPGNRVDGHVFLEQAASCGAIAAVVSEQYTGESFGLPLIPVPDVLSALQRLARSIVDTSSFRVVAVTGSVGKTTVKEFIAQLLGAKYIVAKSPGNGNSQIGLPLAILNHTNGDEDVLVLEMGLSEKGQIAKLVDIAPPDVAVITTTALVHAENFDSLDAIGRAKAEIFSHPDTKLGILHHEIINYRELCQVGSCRKLSFSTHSQEADCFLGVAEDGMRVITQQTDYLFSNRLSVIGRHNHHNFLVAAAVAQHLGMTWEEIDAVVPSLTLPDKRLQFVEKDGVFFVNDSYNASELSVKAALESIPTPGKQKKKVAVLGEMKELGRFSQGCHRAVGEHALQFVDVMICYGDECQPIYDVWKGAKKPVYITKTYEDLANCVRSVIECGDVVLLKGSRSKEMWKVLDVF